MSQTRDAIVLVTDCGAVGDGKTLNTDALQAAIDRVAAGGGGTVVVPHGVFVTGTLHLRSYITLELLAGAVLQGSANLDDYPVTNPIGAEGRLPFENADLTDRHLLLAHDVEHVTLRGPGTIDGRGDAFWQPQTAPHTWIKARQGERPSPMLEFLGARDIRLVDLHIRNSPGWTVDLTNCDRVWVRGVRVENNFWGPNTDAFDICGSHDVIISDCHVVAGDDAFVLKTMPHTRTCERITISNCVCKTNCVGLKLGAIESHQDMRQITFNNCVVYQSTRAVGIYNLRGATFEDIAISNIVCNTDNDWPLNRPIHVDLRLRDDGWEAPSAGTIRNLTISNFIADTDGRILMTNADGGTMENVTLRDVSLRYATVDDPDPRGRDAGGSQFSNNSPAARVARAAVVADGIDNLRIDGLSIDWPGDDADLPPMHAVWCRNCRGGRVDASLAPASRPDVDAVAQDNSDVVVQD